MDVHWLSGLFTSSSIKSVAGGVVASEGFGAWGWQLSFFSSSSFCKKFIRGPIGGTNNYNARSVRPIRAGPSIILSKK